MTSLFAITAATNTLRLDNKRQAETQFTVFNAGGRLVRGRARLVPANPASASWLALAGEAEQDFAIAGTHQYPVRIDVPLDAPAGSYPFRLDMVDVALPDENLTQGPTVTFEVPAPSPVKKPFPAWIPIAIIAAIILVGGIIASQVVPDIVGSSATPTPAATPDLAARFVGTWTSTDRTTLVGKLEIRRLRNGFTVVAQTSAGKVIDTGEGALKGNALVALFPGARLDAGLAEIEMTTNAEGTELTAQVTTRSLVSNRSEKVLYTK